ncbi:MAG: MFS transporter [Anaerolineae bacterium]
MATLTQTGKLVNRTGTLSALRNPNFRLYFVGQMISNSGTWMQNIAQSYLVFEITKSELWLGIVACASGLPIILLSPIAGVIVDRFPRRNLLMFTQVSQMILALILAILTFTGLVQVWHIVVLAVLLGMTNALDMPSRQTIVFEIVGREDMYSGIALNSIMNSLGRVLGPAAAGIALVSLGAAWCFLLNAASYLVVLVSMILIQVPYAIQSVGDESPLRKMREGLSFARRDALIPPLLLLAGIGGFLVLPILRMLPAVADVLLHSPEEGYAALSVAEGTGSVLGGILVGWLGSRIGHGKVIAIALAINALANILLALQSTIPPAVALTAFFGSSMILLFVSLNTAVQTVVPDAFRARVLSLYVLAMLGTSPFGALALGAFADRFGIDKALILNGILIAVLSGAVILRWSHLLRFHLVPKSEILSEVVHNAVGD